MALITLYFLGFILSACLPAYADDGYHLLWQQGDYAGALEAVRKEISASPYAPLSLRRDSARLLFLNGRVDEAIETQIDVARRHPLPSDLVPLAEYQRYRGQWEDAETTLGRASAQARVLADYSSISEKEWLAIGRLYQLQETDAKAILGHYRRLEDQHQTLGVQLAIGDLAFDTRTYDLAAQAYTQALAIDEQDQDALSGLLACYHESGDPRAEDVAAKISALNPHHPRAHTVVARRHLDLGEWSIAQAECDKVLAVNPVHLEALALKAAAHFLSFDTTSHLDLRRRVLDFNPRHGTFDRIVAEIAARHYRFTEAEQMLRAAIEIDARDPHGQFQLALNLLRLGKDEEARDHLEKTFELDPYNVHAFNLLEVADEMKTFTTLTDSLWRLQLPPLEADILAEPMRNLLTEATTLYETKYDIRLERPVTVQMFRDHDAFMVRSTGLPGSAGHLGICFGRLITMDSPRARPTGATNWRQVIWHEFVHVITLQKTRNRMPRWLSEGISVYEETELEPAWGQRLDPAFREIVADGYPNLADLERYFIRPATLNELMFGYFSAGEFIHFYIASYGFDALRASLDRIADGTTASEALIASASTTSGRIVAAFNAHMEQRCAPLQNLSDHDAVLQGPYARAIQEGDRAARKGDSGEATRAYRRADALFPDAMGEGAPLRRLLRLYEKTASPDSLETILTQIVESSPVAWKEARRLAHLSAEREDWASASKAIARAFAVAPFHAGVLTDRARYAQATGHLTAAAEDYRRLIAVDPARQTEHRLQLARVLRDARDLEGARREVVALLEKTPHFWEAQSLLLDLHEEAAP